MNHVSELEQTQAKQRKGCECTGIWGIEEGGGEDG